MPIARYIVVPLVIAIAMAGCTTTDDIQSKTPFRSKAYPIATEPFSLCVLQEVSAQDRGYAFRRYRQDGVVVIEAQLALASDNPGTFVEFELRFIPRGDGSDTSVEVRTRMTIWGTPTYPDTLWPTIDQCARI